MQSTLLWILFLYSFGCSPRFKHIFMFEYISNCTELCLKVFLKSFLEFFLGYKLWDFLTNPFNGPQYPSHSSVLEPTMMWCMHVATCSLGLCAACAKCLDPSSTLVPSNRVKSKSRQNKQGCSRLCKRVRMPCRADLPLLPMMYKVLKAVVTIWGQKEHSLWRRCACWHPCQYYDPNLLW